MGGSGSVLGCYFLRVFVWVTRGVFCLYFLLSCHVFIGVSSVLVLLMAGSSVSCGGIWMRKKNLSTATKPAGE